MSCQQTFVLGGESRMAVTITEICKKGARAILMENDSLSAVILPENGGKIDSLICRETGMELLFQNPKEKYADASFGSSFEAFEACGFDDAFPNVDAEEPYPDHGEIWSASFESRYCREILELSYESTRFGYRYCKKIWLEENRLCIRYTILNTQRTPFPAIWTMHCLCNTEPDMKIVFPPGTHKVITVFDNELTGEKERILPFPEADIDGHVYHFDRVPEHGAVKYFCVGAVAEGCCGYDYPSKDTKVRFIYDAQLLPYLGFWVTAGGFRGDHNCALEPTNGFYDSISKARRLGGGCPELLPGKPLEFDMTIQMDRLSKPVSG